MKLRLALMSLALVIPGVPAFADDETSQVLVPMRELAPADEYFGRARLSVLGIANIIRDSGNRIEGGATPVSMIDGPLSFVGDAIHDWEQQFPSDPWIARDLYRLDLVYLRAHTPQAMELARKTTAWLERDYPDAPQADQAQLAFDEATGAGMRDDVAATHSPADSWMRFAALRAPLPPPN